MSDNFHFDITSDACLDSALRIAFHGAPGGKATHYRLNNRDDTGIIRLILGWGDRMAKGDKLPFPLSVEDSSAQEFVGHWLEHQPYPDNDRPDFFGSTGSGWRIYTERFGRIDDDPYSFVAIEPAMMYYGEECCDGS